VEKIDCRSENQKNLTNLADAVHVTLKQVRRIFLTAVEGRMIFFYTQAFCIYRAFTSMLDRDRLPACGCCQWGFERNYEESKFDILHTVHILTISISTNKCT
jgi:hypothetical protein